MTAKGTLLIIGGAEDLGDDSLEMKDKNIEFEKYELLRELHAGSRNKKIEIITTGSVFQDKIKRRYQKVFKNIGYPYPGFIPIKDKIDVRKEEYLERIAKAGAVFLTGGDQFRLSTILGGTEIINLIRKRYFTDKTFLVAGTSAGAMVMASVMISEASITEALIDRDIQICSGLSLINNCIIDTHFIKRGRFGRLAHAIIINPDQLGIGLGEDTALIIKGSNAECRGSGMVVIIDGRFIRQTNINSTTEGEPVCVENLKVHILVKGCHFSIKTHKFTLPPVVNKAK